MRIYDIIDKKRHGLELNREEIDFFVSGYMSGDIADYQASALLMAICINSMTKEETFYLTDAMIKSGNELDLSVLGTSTVDKHSTGGIGDKTTLIVAPIAASLGSVVAKMSGRGLGFTGGTIDKLESVGVKVEMNADEFLKQAVGTGICVIGQSVSLSPADKKLYALRDVTATVESIPLIASSIMSKKIASGSKSIVLDVKVGTGAFMKTTESAKELARAMIEIGKAYGRRVVCIISDMNVPLGSCVGNSLEIWEAIEVLSGRGEKKLIELCTEVSANMVSLSQGIKIEVSRNLVKEAINNGSALEKFKEWIKIQGGDVSLIDKSDSLLGAKCVYEIKADFCGYIDKLDAEKIGIASMSLGAGRKTKEDKIDPLAGVVLNKTYGDYVKHGDLIATLYSSDSSLFSDSEEILLSALSVSENKPYEKTLIYDIIK